MYLIIKYFFRTLYGNGATKSRRCFTHQRLKRSFFILNFTNSFLSAPAYKHGLSSQHVLNIYTFQLSCNMQESPTD